MSFTGKQRAFIDHYVICLNATEAARLAMYTGDDNALGVVGHRNLRNPKIKAEIDRLFAEHVMSRDEVLKRFSDEARVDMNDFLDERGYIDLTKARRLGKTHLIKSVTQDEIPTAFGMKYRTKLELYDGQSAKVHLGRYYKLFAVKIEHDVSPEALKLMQRLDELAKTKNTTAFEIIQNAYYAMEESQVGAE